MTPSLVLPDDARPARPGPAERRHRLGCANLTDEKVGTMGGSVAVSPCSCFPFSEFGLKHTSAKRRAPWKNARREIPKRLIQICPRRGSVGCARLSRSTAFEWPRILLWYFVCVCRCMCGCVWCMRVSMVRGWENQSGGRGRFLRSSPMRGGARNHHINSRTALYSIVPLFPQIFNHLTSIFNSKNEINWSFFVIILTTLTI